MTSPRPVGAKVSIDHPKHPGIWIVKSNGRVNAVLEPVNGGRQLSAPHYLLTDPTEDDPAPVQRGVFYHPGELVRVTRGPHTGLWVVIADRGADRLNLAKLGGNGGKYLRATRHGLVKVDPADVLKEA